jgi:hypothetical protein
VKFVSRDAPTVYDTQLESIGHIFHEQRYASAIREQPKANDDAGAGLSRVVGDFIGVEPVSGPFEYEWIFSFQLDGATFRFCPCTLECSSEVTRVEGQKLSMEAEDPLVVLVANFDGGYVAILRAALMLVTRICRMKAQERQGWRRIPHVIA